MKLNTYYHLSDDWGWFIDIENNCFNENISLQPYRSVVKKFNSCVNKLPIIQEDEYEYYHKNYKDPEENYDINLKSPNTNINNKNEINKTVDVYCTTLITALFAYVIFIVL
jgi:hypothetical protein